MTCLTIVTCVTSVTCCHLIPNSAGLGPLQELPRRVREGLPKTLSFSNSDLAVETELAPWRTEEATHEVTASAPRAGTARLAGVQGRVEGQEKNLGWVENTITATKGCRHENGVT